MNFVKKIALSVLALLSFNVALPYSATLVDRAQGCMVAAAIGDALGRVTEFILSTDAIFKRYPDGVRTFGDFKPSDWVTVPVQLSLLKIAPYTDDTRMALSVLYATIENTEKQMAINVNKMIADLFVTDMHNTHFGWAANYRAPGNTCLRSVQQYQKTGEWDAQTTNAKGCGSVMRAHPLGLVYHDAVALAEKYAVEQSRITHCHPAALGASGAMAVAVAHCMHHKDVAFINDAVVAVAQTYDAETAQKVHRALDIAKEYKQKLSVFASIQDALQNQTFRTYHNTVFDSMQGWTADDALAATMLVFNVFPDDVMSALYCGVHTPGDSDSIASMVGALVGARVGIHALPQELVERVEDSALLMDLAEKAVLLG